jgi:hypothetical protein
MTRVRVFFDTCSRQVGDDDGCTLASEDYRGLTPDTSAPAGNEGDLVFKHSMASRRLGWPLFSPRLTCWVVAKRSGSE